jgi:hypothetical protein
MPDLMIDLEYSPDCATIEEDVEATKKWAATHNCFVLGVNVCEGNGSANSWPVYTFCGEAADLFELLIEYYNEDIVAARDALDNAERP